MNIKSSWTVEGGWVWPAGAKIIPIAERIEAAPSLRGKPPATAADRERVTNLRRRTVAAARTKRWKR